MGNRTDSRTFYRRHLPHWQPPGRSVFVTWRLHGSLPADFIRQLKAARARLRANGPNYTKQRMRWEARRFRWIDRLLDSGDRGPLWLKDPRVADCVVETLDFCEEKLRLYELHAYVVMSNHVHILVTLLAPLSKLTRTIKAYTARKANWILHRKAQPFWQDESFDHWVRDEALFARIKAYIETNPVKAGLVEKPEDWPWSSARNRQARARK